MAKYKINKNILSKYGFEYKTSGRYRGLFMKKLNTINYFISQVDERISIVEIHDTHKRVLIGGFPIYNDDELEFILNRSLRYISGIPIFNGFKLKE